MIRVLETALLAVAVAGISAFARAATPSQAQGKALYETRCSSCHGLALQGGPNGPPLIGKGAPDVDFMLRTGRMPAAVPWEQPAPGRPSFDDAGIRAIVAYVLARGRGNAALPAVGPGDAERGRARFAQNCQACHGVTGHGASVGYAEVAPSLLHTAPRQIAEAIRTGPGVMPAFGDDVLSSSEIDDIVAYVVVLRTQRRIIDPGGLALGNIGPVAEGFVAWLFGLGLLALFCRRIGTTD